MIFLLFNFYLFIFIFNLLSFFHLTLNFMLYLDESLSEEKLVEFCILVSRDTVAEKLRFDRNFSFLLNIVTMVFMTLYVGEK